MYYAQYTTLDWVEIAGSMLLILIVTVVCDKVRKNRKKKDSQLFEDIKIKRDE